MPSRVRVSQRPAQLATLAMSLVAAFGIERRRAAGLPNWPALVSATFITPTVTSCVVSLTSTHSHLNHLTMLAGALGLRSITAATPRAARIASVPRTYRFTVSNGRRTFSVAAGAADRPLSGIKIVDLTRVLAGPSATMMLVREERVD